MPLILGLIALLAPLLPKLVWQIVISLGIGVISYTGIDALMGNVGASVRGQLGSLSGDVAGVVGLMGVDQAFNIILSAISARVTLSTVGGAFTKMKFTNKAV